MQTEQNLYTITYCFEQHKLIGACNVGTIFKSMFDIQQLWKLRVESMETWFRGLWLP